MYQKPSKNEVIPESKLENLLKDYSSLSDRNFKKETLELFSIGLCESSKIIHQRIMIPIRNGEGEIVGFTGRSVHNLNQKTGGYHPDSFSPKNNSGRFFSKWRTYPKNFNKSIELYNFHEAKSYIQKSNSCFIVEGPFDLWRMWEMGAKNCVSTLGTGLTKYQADKLISADCINLHVLYDSDKAGKEAAEKISKRFNSDFHVYNITLPESTDPASMSQDFFDIKIRPLL
jgi:DNA primase